MDILQVVILALVQGITEFLPISSSAHLILLPQLFKWPDQQLAFDVAVHLGTLTAVVFHYRHTLLSLLSKNPVGCAITTQHHPLIALIIASIPVFVCAYLFEDTIATDLRSPIVIAMATIGFGLLLGFADTRHDERHSILSMRDALLIGAAQALALIPGTSRAGITLTAALLLGFSRTHAAHFSFLLAIPVITAAALYEGMKISAMSMPYAWLLIGIGFTISAVTALLTIRLFLALIRRIGLMPFVVYRIALGGVLLFVFL